MSIEVGFHHGPLCDSYEKQANKQGFTFGDNAELVQKMGFGLVANYLHRNLTDSEYNKALERFNKFLVRKLKEISEGDK